MNRKTMTSLALLTALLATGPALAQGSHPPTNRLVTYIQSLPLEQVDAMEQRMLEHMREEEKLARDIYRVLDQQWNLPIFANIASAEQSHMDLVLLLCNRYRIADPVPSNQVGAFSDPAFTALFQFATSFGRISPLHALLVGAVVEDLDMADLDFTLLRTDNRDIDTLWQNLQRGSRNHMRSFYAQLVGLNMVYPGLFLSTARIQAIVTTPYETVPVDENGAPLS